MVIKSPQSNTQNSQWLFCAIPYAVTSCVLLCLLQLLRNLCEIGTFHNLKQWNNLKTPVLFLEL